MDNNGISIPANAITHTGTSQAGTIQQAGFPWPDANLNHSRVRDQSGHKVNVVVRPAKPTGLTATASDKKVALSWTDPSDSSITKYQVRQKAGTAAWGSWTDIASSSATTTSYTVTGLMNGTAYRFRIRAVNAAGNSPQSDVVGPATPKADGASFTAPASGWFKNGDTVSFTIVATPGSFALNKALRVDIFRRANADCTGSGTGYGSNTSAGTPTTATQQTFNVDVTINPVSSAVSASTNFCVRIAEPTTVLWKQEVPLTNFRVDFTDPGIAWPTSWAPKTGVSGTIVLTDSNAKIAKYGAIPVVGTSTDATGCDTAAEIGSGNLTTLSTPSASVNFAYTPPADSVGKKVCAYAEDVAGNSHAALYGTAIAQGAPAQPTGLRATAGDAQVTLNWTNPNDSTITKYQLAHQKKSATGSASFADITGSGATTTSHTVTGLDNGDAYQFWLRAVNSGGNGTHAGPVEATPASSDTTAPTVTAGSTGYFSEAGATTALTGPLKSGADIYTKVTFSEDMKHVKSDAAAARPELFRRIGTTDTQYHVLNSADTLASGDCRPEDSTSTDVYVCFYTVGSSDSGAFTVKAGTNSVDEADNALAAAYTHAATLTLDTTAPAAPVSLAAEAGDAKATLTWSDPSPADATISKWQYRQKTTGSYGEWQDVTGGASARSVEVGSLSNGTAYTFQVRAVDTAANEGAAGTTDEVTPAAATTTTPTPSGGIWSATLTVAVASANAGCSGGTTVCSTQLTNDKFTHGGTEYTITELYVVSGGSLTFATNKTGALTALSALTLTVGSGATAKTFKVSDAVLLTGDKGFYWADSQGLSWSANDMVALALNAPAATKPAKPTGLTATAGDKQVALSWTDPSDSGITKYQVQQKAGSAAWGSWTDIPSSGATTTSYTVTGLTNGTAYRFRIRAVNAGGNSPQSAVAGPATPAASDTTAPTVTSGSTGYFSDAAATTALTGPLKSGADIYTKVTFSEDMKHVKSDAAAARPELFRRIGSTDTQYHILDSGDTLASGDCRPEDSTSTDVYVCFYTVGSSDSGAFTVKAGTNSVDEADNALAAVYTHAATLALDTTAPGIAWPTSWAPKTGVAGTIVLTDSNAKIAKYGAIPVVGTETTAAGCDTAAEIGSGNLTTLDTPSASVNFEYTPPADSATKKVCAYAEDAAGNSHALLYGTAIAQGAPAQPTGLRATAGDAQVDLAWTDPSDSTITKYQVAYKKKSATGDASFADITGSGATTTSHTVTGLDNGDAYQFWLRAVNSAGNGTHAGPVEATPASSDTTAPTVTSGSTGYFSDAAATTALTGPLKSGADIYTKVTFSEDMKHVKSDAAAARPELSYRIGSTDTRYHILDSGDTLASGDCRPEDSTSTDVYVCFYTVGSSDSGAFTVKAGTNSVDEADNALASVYTHTATLTLDTTAPAAPVSLAAEAGDAKVTLTWSDPSPADATISKWQYRQKDSGSYGEWQDVTGGASARSVEVGSLANGTAYTFQVRAVDTAANEGAAGTTDEVTPAAATTTTPTPGAVWSATLTVQVSSATVGCFDSGATACSTALTQDKFTHGGTEYTIANIYLSGSALTIYTNKNGAYTALSGLTLTVGSGPTAKTFKVSDATSQVNGTSFYWTNSQGLSWSANDMVALRLAGPNSAATGKPSIAGTATVGQTLTAAKGTVADTNGVTRADNGDAGFAYAYQWIRVDSDGSSNAADIPGATSSTYVLKAADRGKKVKVKLGFQDDAGNAESRTSDAHPASGTVAAASTTPTPGAVWSATLTVGHASGVAGCGRSGLPGCATPTVLSASSFIHGGKTYTIAKLYRYAVGDAGAGRLILEFSGLTGAQAKAALSGLTLTVTGGGTDTVLKVSEATAEGNELKWYAFSGARWGDGDTVTLSLAGTATTPAVPPSGANKLVGNVRQAPGPLTVPFKWDAAQKFTTGRHPGGYRLTHVDIAVRDGSPSTPEYSVTIHAPRSTDQNSRKGNLPGEVLATLTNPDGLPTDDGEVASFTVPGGSIDLAPRSHYFVVIDVTGPGDRRVKVRTVAAVGGRYVYSAATAPQAPLDGDSVANWSIGDVAWRRPAGSKGSWTKRIPRPRLQMAVYGTAKAAPQPVPAMVPEGAIWSSSLTVGRLSNFRPWYGCGNWHERFDKCPVALSDDDFAHGGATYKFHGVGWYAKSFEQKLQLILRGPSGEAARSALGSLTLHVDGKAFALGDARVDFTDGFVWLEWPWEGRWREEQLVSLALTDSGTPSGAPSVPPPALEWARVTGAELALRFDKALDESSTPSASAFSVSVAGTARAVSSVSVSGDLVTLTLASAVTAGETVTLGYAPPADGPALRLPGGGAAVAAFSGQAVANDTPTGQPQVQAPAEPLTASVASAPSEHRGAGQFELRIAFSAPVAGRAKDAAIEVTGGTLARASRVKERKDLWALRIEPSGFGAVTVTLPATADCAAAGAVCTADGRRLETALVHAVPGPVTVSVADARAKEGEDATLDFAVTLSRAAAGEVAVSYATRDGTAKKGKDYRLAKGTLVFAAGETAKTVEVAILDDAKDEGEETLRLVLKKATGAVIADGEATGTIENDDPVPGAWLARFGRTVADQAVAAVRSRLGAERRPGFRGRIAGEALPDGSGTETAADGGTEDGPLAVPELAEDERRAFMALLALRTGEGLEPDEGESRAVTPEEALAGTAFEFVRETGDGLSLGLWGRVARSGFSGRAGELSLDGDVATALLGTDWRRRDALFGLMLFRSRGEGGWRVAG